MTGESIQSTLDWRLSPPPGIIYTTLCPLSMEIIRTCCIYPSLSETFREGINNAPGNGEQNITRGLYFLSPVTSHYLTIRKLNPLHQLQFPPCPTLSSVRMLMRGVAGRVRSLPTHSRPGQVSTAIRPSITLEISVGNFH